MFIADLIVALAFGFFIVWVVSLAFGTRGPWGNLLWFFLIVSLFAWAGGVWLVPFGPTWGGIGWLPIILMAIFVSLLLTAASPRTRRWRRRAEAQANANANTEARVVVDAIFWVLLIFLLFFGFGHYPWFPHFR
jgi:hypothetical protein